MDLTRKTFRLEFDQGKPEVFCRLVWADGPHFESVEDGCFLTDMPSSINLESEEREVWVLGYQGPKCGLFVQEWPKVKKTLILFHGVPEIVDSEKCYKHARDCYHAAIDAEQQIAIRAMKQCESFMQAKGELNGEEKD